MFIIDFIKKLFGFGAPPAVQEAANDVPYKVETPAMSAQPKVNDPAPVTEVSVVASVTAPAARKKREPAKKVTAPKKPVTKKAPAKTKAK